MRPRCLLHLLLRVGTLPALLGSASDASAESVRRSEPTTEGEKRLLEWDLNKSFDLSKSRFSSKGADSGKRFGAKSFVSSAFSSKPFNTNSFYSPVYLPQNTASTPGAFSAKTFTPAAGSIPLRAFSKSSQTAPYTWQSSSFQPNASSQPRGTERAFPAGNLSFQGAEAARKEMKFSPENAPKGGLFEGRQLTVDEVREILNKSK